MTQHTRTRVFYTVCSQSVAFKTSASTSVITWEHVQNIGFQACLGSTESETLGCGPGSLSLLSSSGNSESFEPLITSAFSKFERTTVC